MLWYKPPYDSALTWGTSYCPPWRRITPPSNHRGTTASRWFLSGREKCCWPTVSSHYLPPTPAVQYIQDNENLWYSGPWREIYSVRTQLGHMGTRSQTVASSAPTPEFFLTPCSFSHSCATCWTKGSVTEIKSQFFSQLAGTKYNAAIFPYFLHSWCSGFWGLIDPGRIAPPRASKFQGIANFPLWVRLSYTQPTQGYILDHPFNRALRLKEVTVLWPGCPDHPRVRNQTTANHIYALESTEIIQISQS